MSTPPKVIRDRSAMLAGIKPTLQKERFVFCTTQDPAIAATLMIRCVAFFQEKEGHSFVIVEDIARERGFDTSLPMACIVLEVFSALDGVGLTAGVAAALAEANIPCNMIAAYHHDYVFVPDGLAHEAMQVLTDLQSRETAKARS
ncbi:MAG: ACT domain-containing protein [Proteobacteria bacterium]|nr:ACT domain-containing protein [Pseudomonadota bacterium]